ncbi:MAG: MoaD/ThiS family protein [Planctomycetaceae bacterium]
MSSVRVEFLGTPRLYAKTDTFDCEAASVADLLRVLERDFPSLAAHCFVEGKLRSGFLIGVNSRFDSVASDSDLSPGDSVQILSADVGGH